MIPSPKACKRRQGAFRFTESVSIICGVDTTPARALANHLRSRLEQFTGLSPAVSVKSQGATDQIRLDLLDQSPCSAEGYELTISTDAVELRGAYAGLLYAAEALCQLLEGENQSWRWPCLKIWDEPAFRWRGLMLDCSRHFLSKQCLLRYIDILPRLRMNRLHLHINDDHGWRMEMPAHPELTRIGAFVEAETNRQGFYAQEDLHEIVAYAEQRNVMVVPEIEIPGHAYAAMRSYPWLCCTGKPVRNRGYQKDLYCAGKESTFEFLYDVLSEVMSVFPSPYIHIGGDEAPKDRWRDCTACQQRIVHEGLRNEDQLQGYMIRRLSEFLRSQGRQVIGWEEILDGNPEQDAIVQWWRHRRHGNQAVLTAVRKGHRVIASPNSFCYLSFPVTPDEHFKPERTSDLQKVYSAEFIPAELSPEECDNILGAECCVWTEYLSQDMIDRMLFPRVLACAELMWRSPQKRDFGTFITEVQAQEDYWRSASVEYGPYSSNEMTPEKSAGGHA